MQLRFKRQDIHGDTGATIVLALILFPLILLLAAVAIDFVRITTAKLELQRTTDAAALAAAAAVPHYRATGSTAKMEILAEQFNGTPGTPFVNDILGKINPNIDFSQHVSLIGIDSSGAIVAPATQTAVRGVRVERNLSIPSTFAKYLGYDQFSVSTSSVAAMTAPRCYPANFPVALMHCGTGNGNCNPSACWTTFLVAIFQSNINSNAAIFSTDINPNAQSCIDVVNATNNPAFCTGDQIHLNNGVIASCLKAMEDQCAARNCSPSNPWRVFVPFVDCQDYVGGSNAFVQQVPVKGFAEVGIIGVQATGSNKRVEMVMLCDTFTLGQPPGGEFCGVYGTPHLF